MNPARLFRKYAKKLHVGHLFDEVDGAAAVTPFVVVPAENLDEVIANNVGPFGNEDGAVGITLDVAENDRVFVVIENTLHRAFGGALHRGVDGVLGDRLAGIAGEVDDRTGRGGDAEGDARQLAVDGGDDLTDSLGGAGGGRDDVQSGSTTAVDVFVGDVENDLVVGVGVNRGHEALVDTEFIDENFHDRGEAVGRAGRIGNTLVFRLEFGIVDTEDAGQIDIIFGGSAEDDLAGASLDVAVVTGVVAIGTAGETAGAFENDVGSELGPRNIGGIAFGANRNRFAVDNESVVGEGDLTTLETAVGAVVLEKNREILRVRQIVDPDDVEFFGGFHHATENETTDTTETVDTNIDSHC